MIEDDKASNASPRYNFTHMATINNVMDLLEYYITLEIVILKW